MTNSKARSNTSWVRASVLIWFMTSAAACFYEGSAQLGAKNKNNIRFNTTGSYRWGNKIINIWISYSKISNVEVPEHFWPKIAGGVSSQNIETVQSGQVEGRFGKCVPRGPRFVLCSVAFGFLIENYFFFHKYQYCHYHQYQQCQGKKTKCSLSSPRDIWKIFALWTAGLTKTLFWTFFPSTI